MTSDNTPDERQTPMNQPALVTTPPAQLVADPPTPPTGRAYYKWLASALIVDQALWDGFFERCKVMAAGGLYGHRNPNSLAGAVLKGFSLGMDFMEALGKIKVIGGNPVLRGPSAISHIHSVVPGARCRNVTEILRSDVQQPGELRGFPGLDVAALVVRLEEHHPDCWSGDVLDPAKIAVWVMVRPDWDPAVYVFTMAQAELAGLPARNENWRLYPDRCLKWQAASVGSQEMFGDELAGMYLAEELENSPEVLDVASQETPPGATDLPRDPVDRARYQHVLQDIERRLEAHTLPYAFACECALGEQIGDSEPEPEQLELLVNWLGTVDTTTASLAAGAQVMGHRVRVYRSEYGRHRPVVEIAVPGSGRGVVWTGASRLDADQAAREGAHAGLMALFEQRLPEAGEDDAPDPAVVEAAHAALEAEKERIAAQDGVTGRGSTPEELEAVHKAGAPKEQAK